MPPILVGENEKSQTEEESFDLLSSLTKAPPAGGSIAVTQCMSETCQGVPEVSGDTWPKYPGQLILPPGGFL